MVVPELLVVVATDEGLAGLVVGHLLLCALEIRDVIEKVQREQDHGCNKPLECKDDKEKKLISILTSYSAKKDLYFILLGCEHKIVTTHILYPTTSLLS